MQLESMNKSFFTLQAKNILQLYFLRTENLYNEITACIESAINDDMNHVYKCKEIIESLNPKRIMAGGYFAVSDKDGRLLSSVADLHKNDTVTITAADGSAEATITAVRRDN